MAIAPARPDQRSFEHHVLDFLAYLEYERGLSRNTLEAYRSDLLQLGDYLERAGRATYSTRSHEHLAGSCPSWPRAAKSGAPSRAATLQRKAACLRSFYRHLRREDVIDHDPTAELRAPRKSQKLPQVLTRGEVAQLLAAPKGTEAAALRDRALLELMYACGLRASEAIELEVGDIDLRHGVLRARGKGSKERLVPVGREAITARAGLPAARAPGAGRAARGARGCSSIGAAGASPGRASTRSSSATRAPLGSRTR